MIIAQLLDRSHIKAHHTWDKELLYKVNFDKIIALFIIKPKNTCTKDIQGQNQTSKSTTAS